MPRWPRQILQPARHGILLEILIAAAAPAIY
jgi:hypothetical protein